MAITKFSNSSLKTPNRYNDFLAGNAAYAPPSFESIATQTASGTVTNLTFSNIPSTFTHLQVRGILRGTDASYSDNMLIRFNGDSSFIYNGSGIETDNAAISVQGSATTSAISPTTLSSMAASAPSNLFTSYIIDIADYRSTSKFKSVSALSGFDSNIYGKSAISFGLWRSTNAITSIAFSLLNGSIGAGSTFALYGIKEA